MYNSLINYIIDSRIIFRSQPNLRAKEVIKNICLKMNSEHIFVSRHMYQDKGNNDY